MVESRMQLMRGKLIWVNCNIRKQKCKFFSSSEIGDVITMSRGLQGEGEESGWDNTTTDPGDEW